MELKDYYVYAYMREDQTPYYIGKGCLNRINDQHRGIVVPPEKRRVKIRENLSERESLHLERELIVKYKRKVDGGILDNKALPPDVTKPMRREKNYGQKNGLKMAALWLTPEEDRDFKAICKANGETFSGVVRSMIRKTIEDETIDGALGGSDEMGDLRRRIPVGDLTGGRVFPPFF